MDNGSFTVTRSLTLRYLVSLPDGFDGSKNYPMIVFLHGAGERGDDIERVKINALPKYISQGKKYPAVILCPQCPDNAVWGNIAFELKELIDWAAGEYHADKSRISLTGLSMGGFGTWEMAQLFPESFSAIAPVCGGGMTWRCGALKDTPVRAFHGALDEVVPLSYSAGMADAVNACGGHAELTVFQGDGHNSWDSAYLRTDVTDWLIKAKRGRKT